MVFSGPGSAVPLAGFIPHGSGVGARLTSNHLSDFLYMTPEKAEALQVEMWRQLSLEERFRLVAGMIEDGFKLAAASIRAAHPEYTPEEVRTALRKGIYDD
jgi:hypothetical protein